MPEPEGRCRDCKYAGINTELTRICNRPTRPENKVIWSDAWCPDFKRKPDVADRIASRWYGPDAAVVCTNKGMISSLAEVIREELAKEKP